MSFRNLTLPLGRTAVMLGTLALALGACTSDAGQESNQGAEAPEHSVSIDPDPVEVQEPAAEADLNDVQIPMHLGDSITVDPQWDTPPQVHDDVFLAPGEEDGKLIFSAVDADGTLLWTAERPLSCSGFAVTTADDQPLAVLTNLTEDDDAADEPWGAATATAYDLRTGEEVWGPVEVPGPHQGPGLVFAESSDGPMGNTGQRAALDSSTGEPTQDDAQVVGEYFGTVVVTEGDDLVASTDGGSNEVWRVPIPEHLVDPETGELNSPPSNRLPPGSALIGSAGAGFALWDLTRGELMDDELDDALFDLMSDTWIGLREGELTAMDASGEHLWSEEIGADSHVLGVGGVMAYILSESDELSTYNAVAGSTSEVFDPLEEGDVAVPLAFTDRGAAVVDTGTELLLVTETPRPAEDYEDGDAPPGPEQ